MKQGSKIMRWLILGFVISLAFSCDNENNLAPPEDSYFKKYYGGEGDQEGVDMVVNSDGTFLLFGTTRAPSSTSQLYLVKADARGKVMWEETFGGAFDDEARDIELTRSGNIVLLGNTKTADGDRDIMIMTVSQDGVKLDSSGYSLNSATIKLDEFANSVTETSDGFIVAGYTNNVLPKPNPVPGAPDLKDALYVRFLNSPLRVYPNTWVSVSGAQSSDETSKIIEVSPNIFYMFGYTNNQTTAFTYDFWYFGIGSGGVSVGDVKIPYLGNEISAKTILNPPSIGGGIMIGSSINSNGDSAIYMVKFRSPLTFLPATGGDIEAIQVVSSPLSLAGASICYSQSSGYLILSDQRSGSGNSDIALTRVNASLIQQWTQPTSLTFGGACEDTAGAVAELSDGRILIIGTIRTGDECESKMALFKLSKDGKFEE